MDFKLHPGGANRWVPCPGSPMMEAQFPNTPKHPTTEEGIAAHWATEKVAFSWLPVNQIEPFALQSMLGAQCPENGVFITDEMVYGGGVYLESLWNLVHSNLDGFRIEHQVALQHRTGPVAGRLDARFFTNDGTRLTLWDFKFGYRPVDAFMNWQLIIYALGSVTRDTKEIELIVVQPRGPGSGQPVKRWLIDIAKLTDLWRWVSNSILLARSAAPPTHAGPWCHYCKAAGNCDTLDRSSYRAMEYSGTAVVVEMDERQIAVDLEITQRAIEQLKAREMGLEALAISRIQGGKIIPGYVYRQSQANRSWTKPPDEMIAMGQLLGVDLEVKRPATPNDAEGRGMPRAVIDLFTERLPTKAKLKRQNINEAREAFRTK